MHFSKVFKYCPNCGSKQFVPSNDKSCYCEVCSFNYFINASAAVAAFIVNSKNELLVCVRANEPAKGTLDLPGGFVDNNENAEEALTRELLEELGGIVIKSEYLFSIPNEYEYSGLTIPTLDLFFSCKLHDLSVLKSGDDVSNFYFIPISELNSDEFGLKSINKAIEKFKKNLSADIRYK